MKDITINNTTLSFNEIIYVDAVNGNDTTGSGSEQSPYASLSKAINVFSDGDAVYLKEGTYTSPSFPAKHIVLVGEGLNTIIDNGTSAVTGVSGGSITAYRIVWKWKDRFLNSVNKPFTAYNCVFSPNQSNNPYIVYSNTGGHTFENCTFVVEHGASSYGGQLFIGGFGSNGVTLKNCYYKNRSNGTGRYSGTYYVTTSLIRDEFVSSFTGGSLAQGAVGAPEIDADYAITTMGWKHAGTGINPDNSTAHIGVYGGPFAWGSWHILVEAYLNINETYNQLVNVSGTVTHEEGTNTRYRLVINGVGQSWTNFLSVPITIDASVNPLVLNYGDNVIVVEAEDIDGIISSSSPLNITRIVTELIQPQEVYANKVNIKWLPILSPSLLDMDVSLVRAVNGFKKFNINTQDTNYEDTDISMNKQYSYMLADAKGYAQVSCGYYHCTALKSDGSLVSWGYNNRSQVSKTPTGTDFVQVSCGYEHCTALKSDGSLVSWGYNLNGQVSNTPTGTDFVQVSCGRYHCTALKSDGSLVSWGYNEHGQVSNTPTGTDFVQISCGYYHCTALKSDGSLVSWGYNEHGQVSNTPTGTDFVQVSCGNQHCTALRSDGSLVSWGYNEHGQVSNTPTGTDFVQISCGRYHCTALKSDGSLVSWGYNEYGQVSNTPTGTDFVQVSCGNQHCTALRSDGSLVSWGRDNYGVVSNTPTGKNIQISQNVISIITPSSFGYVYKWINGEYVLKVIEGLAFDDATVDHNFYSVPPNIILRPLNLGDLIGNKMSDVFKFEVINTYEEKNLTVTLYAVDQNDNKALQVSNYGEFQDSETPEFRSQIMFDYDEAFSSGGFYPAVFELNAGAKKVIYCKFKPGIDSGIGEKIMHIVATTGSW